MRDALMQHYLRQVGRGVDAPVGPVYRAGFSRGQRGSGFSDVMRGLWSWASPIFTSGARALGQQALNTGAKILTDANTDPSDRLSNIAKRRLNESRDDIVKKLKGGGRGGGRKGLRGLLRGAGVKKKKKTKTVVKRGRRAVKRRTKGDIFESI